MDTMVVFDLRTYGYHQSIRLENIWMSSLYKYLDTIPYLSRLKIANPECEHVLIESLHRTTYLKIHSMNQLDWNKDRNESFN